jgi:predicted amidohydrolase
MGYEGTVGTLKPGANADVAVFGLRDGSFELKDSDGDASRTAEAPGPLCQTTVKDGRIWARTAGGSN